MGISFERNELIAIVKLANAMIAADGKVEDNEMSSWVMEMERLGVDRDDFPGLFTESENLSFIDALTTVSGFDEERKKYVGAFLGALMIVDGNIDDDEVKLWQLTSTYCNLPTMTVAEALEYMADL